MDDISSGKSFVFFRIEVAPVLDSQNDLKSFVWTVDSILTP